MGSSTKKSNASTGDFRLKKKTGKANKGPLPMKLRALPQSFWQQPNAIDAQPPSACTPLPPITPLDQEEPPRSLQVTPADIDLLFSLFSALPNTTCEGHRPKARRGRPRKNIVVGKRVAKDEDPYVTSAAVPEVKFQKEAMVETQVLALMTLNEHNIGPPPTHTSYTQRLQELAINL